MPRIIKSRTNLEIQALSKLPGDHYVGGAPGLLLRVWITTTGIVKNTWLLSDQRKGRRHVYRLNKSFPTCSPKKAREIATKMRLCLKNPNLIEILGQGLPIKPEASKQQPKVTVEQAMMEYLDTKETTRKNGQTESLLAVLAN